MIDGVGSGEGFVLAMLGALVVALAWGIAELAMWLRGVVRKMRRRWPKRSR